MYVTYTMKVGAQWLPGERGSPGKNAPPQKVPICRFYLLSLLKTRSDSPGAAPPRNFPILKHYASSSNIRMSRVFLLSLHKALPSF